MRVYVVSLSPLLSVSRCLVYPIICPYVHQPGYWLLGDKKSQKVAVRRESKRAICMGQWRQAHLLFAATDAKVGKISRISNDSYRYCRLSSSDTPQQAESPDRQIRHSRRWGTTRTGETAAVQHLISGIVITRESPHLHCYCSYCSLLYSIGEITQKRNKNDRWTHLLATMAMAWRAT